jgi:hypothetical protein
VAASPREAADTFVGFLQETISCISADNLTAYRQSNKLYKVWTQPHFELKTRTGARLFISITQVFSVGPHPTAIGQFKAKTREYSYRLTKREHIDAAEILAYHWHPHDFDVRHPHLHVTRVPRVHFPTSRVCLEDFIEMTIRYFGVRPMMKYSEWSTILDKNKRAFEKMASWKVQHP